MPVALPSDCYWLDFGLEPPTDPPGNSTFSTPPSAPKNNEQNAVIAFVAAGLLIPAVFAMLLGSNFPRNGEGRLGKPMRCRMLVLFC